MVVNMIRKVLALSLVFLSSTAQTFPSGNIIPNPVSIIGINNTATVTAVANTTTSTVFLAANPLRLGFTICNTVNQTLLLSTGGVASNTNFFASLGKTAAAPWFCTGNSFPVYTGQIMGVWSAVGAGNAIITELQ